MSRKSAGPLLVLAGLVLGLATPAGAAPSDYAGTPPPDGGSHYTGAPPPGDYAGLGPDYSGIRSDYVAVAPPQVTAVGADPTAMADTADVGGRPAGTSGFPLTTGDLAGLTVLAALVVATLATLRRRSH